jgi:glycolate oxidase iron-sulfur subunit
MSGERSIPDLLGDCVHCGFCLPACPTYELWGEEMDSPRGRIHLMLGLEQGDELAASTVGHFDACLGCMACMTACPSGVDYSTLIEQTRADVEQAYDRPLTDRVLRGLIFFLFPYPARLRAAILPLRLAQRSGLYDRLAESGALHRAFPRLMAMAALAPPAQTRPEPSASVTGPGGRNRSRGRVALLTGCVQDVFFPHVNTATLRVLAAEGIDVVVPPGQGCCGALSLHSGRQREAARMARNLIAQVPSDVDAVITTAAGCGSSLKSYGSLLSDDPQWATRAAEFAGKVRDVTEYVASLPRIAERHELPLTVAYHDACHLSHAQSVRSQPRQLLRDIPGLELREVADGDVCCGSAGIYNLLNPGPAAEFGSNKARNVARTASRVLVAGNPGCLLQIQRFLRRGGAEIETMHTIELIAASLDPDTARALVARLAPAPADGVSATLS